MRFLFIFIFFAVALSFSYKGQLWFDSNFSDQSDDITFYEMNVDTMLLDFLVLFILLKYSIKN